MVSKQQSKGVRKLSLRDIEIKNEYRSLIDNVAKDFYIPLLKQAILYKRAVGWFSSTALIEISKGLMGLVKNGGIIQLITSPRLSEEDISAIKRGYELRHKIIENALIRELHEPISEFDKKRLNLLANLITDGVLDIKIALTETEQKGTYGMYHEKMGIIQDADGNKVAFSGSMNESAVAMLVNYETIDVFCSWNDDENRIAAKENAFTSIWNNTEPNIETIEFPKLKKEIIERFKISKIDYKHDTKEYLDEEPIHKIKTTCTVAIPSHVKLHEYQTEAIDEWERKDFRGIFDMATGTGKTFTGLGALVRLCDAVEGNLAVIIVCPYQHLVEQWVEDIEIFNIKPIIGYSSSSQKNWYKDLEDAIRDQKLKVRNRKFICFICTNATFALNKVQQTFSKIRSDILLVVDEAHNFGAKRLSDLLLNRYNYRLALSATLERHNDEEGTARLYNFFGEKCINYPLERAIDEGKLTRYKYFPILTTLSEPELAEYSQLSYEISKYMIFDKSGKRKLSEKGKRLALKRARLVGGATDKIAQLENYIQPYIKDKHILVYCGATTILPDNKDYSDTSDEDIRQIDAVTDLLGNKLGMNVAQFTSREDVQKRETLKEVFAAGDTMQVLVAIKCLDEGVNIPKIKTAFILASTTNPKEYIQRRGRVLRLAEGKEIAEIYDFLAMPRPLDGVQSLTDEQLKRELTLVKNELCRAEEFARLAINMMQAENVIKQVKEAYSINDYLLEYEEEYTDG